MKEFKQILLGDADIAQFAAALLFALLTAFALLMFRATKRDINSPRSPVKWSWSFLWNDNMKRNVGTVILIFLTIRLSQFYIKPEWTIYGAVIIGLISDQLAMLALKLKDATTKLLSKKIDSAVDKADPLKDTDKKDS